MFAATLSQPVRSAQRPTPRLELSRCVVRPAWLSAANATSGWVRHLIFYCVQGPEKASNVKNNIPSADVVRRKRSASLKSSSFR